MKYFFALLFTTIIVSAVETSLVSEHAPEHAKMDRVVTMMGARPGLPPVERSLTPEQRQQLRAAIEANRAQITQLNEQLRAARQAVLETQLAEKFDETAFRAHTEAAAKVETELALINARAFAAVRPSLTPEQISQIRKPVFNGGAATGDRKSVV